MVACVGTCGKIKKMDLPSQERFKGKICHSSELDDVELKGKKVSLLVVKNTAQSSVAV